MYNPDTELLFPLRVIPHLSGARAGSGWSTLIERLTAQDCPREDRLAFALIMVKMGGCATCTADSFRAMRGCTACARQTARRYRGSDQEMLDLMRQARKDVDLYIKKLAP